MFNSRYTHNFLPGNEVDRGNDKVKVTAIVKIRTEDEEITERF